jgi:hypothetical protein
LIASATIVLAPIAVRAQPEPAEPAARPFTEKGFFGSAADRTRRATPPESLLMPPGFRAELLYTVPLEKQGSWVCLCVDPRGRLIASAQGGGLFRITLPAQGAGNTGIAVEPLDLPIRGAQGLVCAFDSLYAVASNDDSALYRLRDADGDDGYDQVTLLRRIVGDGEHGPHAVVAGPDGRSLYLVGGNGSHLAEPPERSRLAAQPKEDRLARRIGASDGEFTPRRPGGWVCRTDPEGRSFELVALGFRNAYDLAFGPDGELFTFDSDMEWDQGTPWYRPTRINHVTSGADFGWRSGTAKWPEHYFDGAGAVVDVGLGSPTGIAFGAGAKFPAKYQRALFAADWSMGNIYAVHLEPQGASFTGNVERFVTGAPLPVTDLVIHPRDGALYFVVGGRGITSALYRITYEGDEPTSAVSAEPVSPAVALRRELEAHHRPGGQADVDAVWPYLAHADRAVRYAARVGLEHQPPALWQERALAEPEPRAAIAALVALARVGERGQRERIYERLARLEWVSLPEAHRLDLVRAWMVALARFERPSDSGAGAPWRGLDRRFPTGSDRLDRELAEVLTFLEAPELPARLVPLLDSAKSQEQQIHYAHCLTDVQEGWTSDLQRRFLKWHGRAAGQRGGVTFAEYQAELRERALARVPAAERPALAKLLESPPAPDPLAALRGRPLVKAWAPEDVLPIAQAELQRADRQRGGEVFAAALCYHCHRFRGAGGSTGPDLTALAGRFNAADLIDALLRPSQHVSDQYRAVTIVLADGRVLSGKIKDIHGNTLLVTTDPFDPASLVMARRDQIEALRWSEVSPMPSGLLDSFSRDEIVDLVAYLLRSR